MSSVFEVLFATTWWTYPPRNHAAFGAYYHWFNLAEGVVWLGCAAYVALRYRRHRHSLMEVWYAAAFVLFGCSDFWEAYQLTSWLLWLKLTTLTVLLRLSWLVRKRFYPTAKAV